MSLSLLRSRSILFVTYSLIGFLPHNVRANPSQSHLREVVQRNIRENPAKVERPVFRIDQRFLYYKLGRWKGETTRLARSRRPEEIPFETQVQVELLRQYPWPDHDRRLLSPYLRRVENLIATELTLVENSAGSTRSLLQTLEDQETETSGILRRAVEAVASNLGRKSAAINMTPGTIVQDVRCEPAMPAVQIPTCCTPCRIVEGTADGCAVPLIQAPCTALQTERHWAVSFRIEDIPGAPKKPEFYYVSEGDYRAAVRNGTIGQAWKPVDTLHDNNPFTRKGGIYRFRIKLRDGTTIDVQSKDGHYIDGTTVIVLRNGTIFYEETSD